MLITQLGKTRLRLLASVQSLDDERLNWQPDPRQPSAARIILHVAAVECAIADDILGALGSPGEPVADQTPAALGALIEALSIPEPALAADPGQSAHSGSTAYCGSAAYSASAAGSRPSADARMLRLEADGLPGGPARTAPGSMTKQALVRLLEESRFRHLQRVFNETHERVLAAKSMQHPRFGRISLKNLADLIWLHDAHQIDYIARIRAAQDQAGGNGPAVATLVS